MNIQDLLKNESVRLAAALVVGVTVGVIFYPSKKIEERTSQKYEQQISSLKESHSKETQNLKETIDNEQQQSKLYKAETERKITSLTSQVSDLKSKQKIATYKLVKPDGTIEERTFTETDIDSSTRTITRIQDEFKQKVESIEQKWSKVHEERVAAIKKNFDSKEQAYQKTISSLETSKITTINEKRFGLEAGITNEKNYYGHATMDVWGPTFIGVHGQVGANGNNANNMGIGLGLRF